jgi:hypothetical protein
LDTSIHARLKEWGKLILADKGCNEVIEECSVKLGRKRYVIDLVGLGKDKIIACECEFKCLTKDTKLNWLKDAFDEVIVIDIVQLLYYYESTVATLVKILQQKDQKIQKLMEIIRKVRSWIDAHRDEPSCFIKLGGKRIPFGEVENRYVIRAGKGRIKVGTIWDEVDEAN